MGFNSGFKGLIIRHVFILRTSHGATEELTENVCPQTNTCNDV